MRPEKLMDSLTSNEFAELEAYDQVMPLDHSERMLGLLAFMVAKYLEMDFGGDDELRLICMPWLPKEKTTSETAIAALSPIAKPKRNE